MIVIDFREKDSIIPTELEKLGVPIKFAQLEVGDYVVTGEENICVERKETNDYVGSLSSGHLNNQLVAMSKNYGFSILIVEGTISMALNDTQTKRSAYLSSLMGSVVKRSPDGKSGTVSVVCVENAYDTSLCLKFLHDKNNSLEGLIRLPKLNPIHFSEEESVVAMLGVVPGVGEKIAKGLLKKFGNIQKIGLASLEELMEVEKVGKVKAERIFRFFRLYYKEKSST